MRQGQSEIVVLKPTNVFLSFLASQASTLQLPDLSILQTDTTAYVIAKQNSDKSTLDKIEQHFSSMFRHEICRWLGKDARNQIESNFLDFLCCFKFELHNHIILMEPSIDKGNQLLLIKPRLALLEWLRSTGARQEDLAQEVDELKLSQLEENATVMVKNFADLKEIKPFVQEYYKPIYTTAMSRMSNQADSWPLVNSFQAFKQYFAIEIHTQLLHLCH